MIDHEPVEIEAARTGPPGQGRSLRDVLLGGGDPGLIDRIWDPDLDVPVGQPKNRRDAAGRGPT